jgi:hypothetical protein
MIRLVGTSMLALTLATGAAQAAHRHHGGAVRYVNLSRQYVPHYRSHREYAGFGRVRRSVVAERQIGEGGFAREQDPPRLRGSVPAAAMQNAYASYAPVGRTYGAREYPAERRYAVAHTRVSGGRPRAWCGWYARSLVGSDPGPNFNLARNWAHWGHASGPGIGVMVVWSHHVGMITGRSANGEWIVKSGNDGGGMVRERPRSIAGAIAFRSS